MLGSVRLPPPKQLTATTATAAAPAVGAVSATAAGTESNSGSGSGSGPVSDLVFFWLSTRQETNVSRAPKHKDVRCWDDTTILLARSLRDFFEYVRLTQCGAELCIARGDR